VKKTYIFRLIMLIFSLAVMGLIQRIVVPKYEGKVIEGNFTAEYYQEEIPHDLLILGDCEVYENISPVTLWEEYGISSYIRGNAQQLMAQSYYLLEDTLKYETPQAVLLSISAMQEAGQINEAYNRMTLDGMRWSKTKIDAIRATGMEDEHIIEYVFPLLRYHSRWQELEADDFRYIRSRPLVSHNGYYMRADIQAATDFPAERRRANYQFPDSSYHYLDKIRTLCEQRNIELILYKAPSLYPVWYDEWNNQMETYAREYDLAYINCISLISQIGLDFNRDTYNGGQRLNVYGAEKLARYLGEYLQDYVKLEDHRDEEEYQTVWTEKVQFYKQMKADQEQEWNSLGYIRRFSDIE